MIDLTQSIGQSRLFWGACALAANFGSRYLLQDFGPAAERVLSHALFKRIVVFSIVFLTTRDVLLSFAITVAVFALLSLADGSDARGGGLRVVARPGHHALAKPLAWIRGGA